uniref:Uncharacterized protein n=1 Tax=Anguilla anguilla TaxID=7936 RepID=A0A0E9Q085_ANGAN
MFKAEWIISHYCDIVLYDLAFAQQYAKAVYIRDNL